MKHFLDSNFRNHLVICENILDHEIDDVITPLFYRTIGYGLYVWLHSVSLLNK